MPYEDFPPLEERKTGAPNGATLDQATGAAQWAETFGKGDTNLMLRKRHNQDIKRETEVMQQRQAEQQQNELRTSKTAQDLYFRSGKLEMDKKLGAATLDLREQKFNHDQEMLPAKLETERARLARLQQQEREAEKVSKFKEETDAQVSMDREAFTDNMRASGAKPGTQAYVDELVRNRINFPSTAISGLYDDLFKAYSGSKADSEEVFETRKAALAAAGANTTVTARLPGGVTITDRPGSDETKALQTRYDKFVLQRAKTTDKNVKVFLDGEISEMKGKLDGFEKGLVAPAATAAPNQAALDWVNANPTDPRSAAIKAKLGIVK